MAAKLLQLLPCGVLVRQPAPLDTNMPDATPQLGAHSNLRLWKNATMEKWRHDPRRSRRLSTVRLEQPHMENVMDLGAVLKP
jgi:hypothetical protein